MPEPLSIAGAAFWGSYLTLATLCKRNTSACSDDAGKFGDSIRIVKRLTDESEALFGKKSQAISDMFQVANKCVSTNWDGDGAEPVTETTLQNAETFVRCLPDDITQPIVSVDSDGAISFDWITDRAHMFSVSVSARNRLSYAWLSGSSKGYAVEDFDGASVSNIVKDALKSIRT